MLHTEQQIQMMVVQFLRLQYPGILFTTSGAGLITNARTGAKMKKLGYNPGFPDLFIVEPRGELKGLFLELKSEKGRVNELQKQWLEKLTTKGYKTCVCNSFEQAVDEIKTYLP